jgi:CspA family cold shock protein
MTLTGKLIVSLAIAAAAAALINFLPGSDMSFLLLLAVLFIATAATAVIVTLPPSLAAPKAEQVNTPAKPQKQPSRKKQPTERPASASTERPAPDNQNREQGEVKWFNVSKGFGFITMDNDEEVFVHFRSIRGEGRRSLRDGQRVSFIVAQSDKGPQAEDVDALD